MLMSSATHSAATGFKVVPPRRFLTQHLHLSRHGTALLGYQAQPATAYSTFTAPGFNADHANSQQSFKAAAGENDKEGNGDKAMTGLMLYVMMHLARRMETGKGVERVCTAAEQAAKLMEEARPLMHQSIKLQSGPAVSLEAQLSNLHLSGTLEELVDLTYQGAEGVRKARGTTLSQANIEELRAQVLCLSRTMEHIDGIASDAGLFSQGSAVQRNLEKLVAALNSLEAAGTGGSIKQQHQTCEKASEMEGGAVTAAPAVADDQHS